MNTPAMAMQAQRKGKAMIELKRDTTLVGACTEYGSEIPTYDDSMGTVWIFSTSPYGSVDMVIRARHFEDAWGIAIDESATIPESEVPEAYGFDSQAKLDAAVEAARESDSDWPELQEGYEYQSSASGTGIVNVGDYGRLWEWHRDSKVRLVIRHYDSVDY